MNNTTLEQQTTNSKPKGGYAAVNGMEMYYEISGTGTPLILLHGGFGSTEMFTEVLLPALSAERQVIGVDLQGHGRTADIDRPLSWELMADDIGAFIQHLKLEQADVMGYSLGGGVALQTAIRHPELVRKVVVVSAPFKREDNHPEILASMEQLGAHTAQHMLQTPMYEHYAKIAPKPEDWSALWGKMGDLMRQDYDFTQDIAATKVPMLIVAGDSDFIAPVHVAKFFGLLGGGQRDGGWDGSGMSNSRLAILPGTTHYNIIDSPLLAAFITPFLETAVPNTK